MENFKYTHQTSNPAERRQERFFSAVPGGISWILLIGMLVLSFARPLWAAVIVIAYHIYWLFRLFYMTLFLVLAYGVLAVEKDTHWLSRCRLLSQGERGLSRLRRKIKVVRKPFGLMHWLSFRNQEREFKRVIQEGIRIPDYESLYHLVIIAAANESEEIVEPGLRALAENRFPTLRMIPVIAVEERTGAEHRKNMEALAARYRSRFFELLVTSHPARVSGEKMVKGANVTFAARQAAAFLDSKAIPYENVIVSCFDADTVAGREYFTALTYHFMRHPGRHRMSYQPIPVYDNNIWEASGFARVLEMGSSFFQLIEATNPEKLVTFSSHSMSFKALVEIGYWPVDMISDDSAIFWKAFIHYDGDYRVVPMYMTVSMDAVTASTVLKSIRSIYRQKRRWAWGVENFPIVMRAFMKKKAIPPVSRLRYGFKLLEMNVSWATLGFFITFIGWLPAIFASREFSNTVLYYNSTRITGLIFNLASAAFVIMMVLSYFMLPKIKSRFPVLKRILYVLEWVFVPLVFTFLSTLPALDAQTRLMFGRDIQFRVTRKERKSRT